MKNYDLMFLVLATVMLITGVAIGIFMAGSQQFQYAPIHAHVNLVGWASLALFGLVYRAYPRLGTSRLAIVHFLLAASGAVLLPVGIALAVLAHSEAIAMVSSMLWLGACLTFLIQLLSLFSDKQPAPHAAE